MYCLYVRFDADKLAMECKMKLYRTSVKEDLNVAVVFQHSQSLLIRFSAPQYWTIIN